MGLKEERYERIADYRAMCNGVACKIKDWRHVTIWRYVPHLEAYDNKNYKASDFHDIGQFEHYLHTHGIDKKLTENLYKAGPPNPGRAEHTRTRLATVLAEAFKTVVLIAVLTAIKITDKLTSEREE